MWVSKPKQAGVTHTDMGRNRQQQENNIQTTNNNIQITNILPKWIKPRQKHNKKLF